MGDTAVAERDGYIPGVPCWTDTSQPDPDAAAAFYGGLFGWEFEDVMPGGSDSKYLIGRLRGLVVAAVASKPDGAAPTASWNTYIAVESAEATADAARAAGGSVVTEPVDVLDAGRMAALADPEEASFRVWQAIKHKGAQIVNEPGSVNFNVLSTRDPDGAAAFYGAVFGWQRLALPSGLMWTLPGYGDHLEDISPGTRERFEQLGAPEGFIDVVAALSPIGADDAETPAHWGVMFAVDDADAVAAKASKLGGTVSSEPVDAPWSRTAVIEDPQGARFVASAFVPENRDLEG
jgi:predicted enzyme related to lactoylglutathione lyase